jgi:hypothetical protein
METLTIEYALARGEIVRGFFQSVGGSKSFRLSLLRKAAFLGLFVFLLRAAIMRSVSLQDGLIAVAFGLGVLFFLPLALFMLGKTGKRTLTLSDEGISTEIGALKGTVPWHKVKLVSDTGQFILITNSRGNAFIVPSRAFSGPEQRALFLSALSRSVAGPS